MRTRASDLAGAASLLAVLAGASTAGADEYGRGIDAQLYRPALDNRGIFSLEGARGIGANQFALRLGSSFAQEPLGIDTLGDETGGTIMTGDGEDDQVLDRIVAVNFGFAFGFADNLTFGFEIPVNLQPLGAGYGTDFPYKPDATDIGTGFYSTREDQNVVAQDQAVGDLRIGLKYSMGRMFALQVVTWLPFGDEDVFAGSSSFTVEPRLIFEMPLGKKLRLVVNAGARIREGQIAETRRVDMSGIPIDDDMGQAVYLPKLFVGSEALAGAGVTYVVSPRMNLGVEAYGFIPIAGAAGDNCEDPCKNGDPAGEALVGIDLALVGDIRLALGAGTSIVPGAARSPAFRVLAGLAWSPTGDSRAAARGDGDGDGVPDGPDVCPDEPEDSDDFQDDDGCPELDNDLDGVLDAQDRCKDEPEDRDGYEDNDGCPEGDNDNDKVPDLNDRCPGEAEDMDGFADDDGCPDDDNDGDGILDAKDQCPEEPETVNGYQDLDGCPDQTAQGGPKLTATSIDLQGERVDFVGKTDKLTRASETTLDAVAAILKSNPRVRFRIEVGVEESGKRKRDKDQDRALTERRAAAVRGYLIGKGVEGAQLDPAGLGSDRPIDKDVKNVKNRRVEFIRLNQ